MEPVSPNGFCGNRTRFDNAVKIRIPQRLKKIARRARHASPGVAAANPLPDWGRILRRDSRAWSEARAHARAGPRVLIGTTLGGYSAGTIVESLLAVALTLRGANAQILLCDHVLPACQQAAISRVPAQTIATQGPQERFCPTCFAPGYAMYKSLGLEVHRLSESLTTQNLRNAAEAAAQVPLSELADFTQEGWAIGEHAYAGTLRFFARGDLGDEAFAEPIARRYLEAALRSAYAISNLQQKSRFESTVFHHGLYVPQGILGEVARQSGVRVINWAPGYRKQRFIFTHKETYHHALMTEPTSDWENIAWDAALENEVMEYLKSRWQGSRDWIWFHEKPEEELSTIAAQLGIDFNRPTIGMLTNVMWDAQLHYRANAFPNMLDWTLRTIQYFRTRPDLQLVIRIHPAEIRGTIPSRQPLLAEIKKAFPELPPNVFVIAPESPISTYVAMLACNAVLIYGTKTGVELTSLGVPVIAAGEAWIRNKGVTLDASTPGEYFQFLERLPMPGRLDAETTERARKYAYHFFFRRMIPLGMVQPTGGDPPYGLNVNCLDELRQGKSAGLDIICDGILKGSEFIYPAETSAEYFE